MPMETLFLKALLTTVLTETAALLCVARLLRKKSFTALSTPRLLAAGFFASFATLPYLWFVAPSFIGSYTMLTLVGETGVALLEGLFYYFFLNLRPFPALALSIVCNLVSIVVGLLFFR